MADYEYAIGTTEAGLTNLEDVIGVPPSGVRFQKFPLDNTGGTGISVGAGYPSCSWVFEYLSWPSYTDMLSYLGDDASAVVYITTRKPDNTYASYTAVLHRPQVPNKATQHSGSWLNVTFDFTHLVSV